MKKFFYQARQAFSYGMEYGWRFCVALIISAIGFGLIIAPLLGVSNPTVILLGIIVLAGGLLVLGGILSDAPGARGSKGAV